MLLNDPLTVLETLSLIYEDLDVNNVEEKLVELVHAAFGFDRVALLFVKHRKKLLQGKLSMGFDAETISHIALHLDETHAIATPLFTGEPYWGDTDEEPDPALVALGLHNYVVIPIINRKRVACWEERGCQLTDCPVHGKRVARPGLIAGGRCTPPGADPWVCPSGGEESIERMEGLLLADNSPSGALIKRESVTALSIIARAVGQAINNSKSYQKALSDAVRDPLTHLHNRRFLHDHVLDEIDRCRRYQDPFSLVMCDIDHFKEINDAHGHVVGDRVLQWVARTLKERCRRTDVVARFGGEEFAVVLTKSDAAEAMMVARSLRGAFDVTAYDHEGEPIRVTLSFGVASFPADATDYDALFQQADAALYEAKRLGRNRVCAARPPA